MDNDDIELYSLETCGVSSICTYFVNISAIEMHALWPWNRGYIAFWLCQETIFFNSLTTNLTDTFLHNMAENGTSIFNRQVIDITEPKGTSVL